MANPFFKGLNITPFYNWAMSNLYVTARSSSEWTHAGWGFAGGFPSSATRPKRDGGTRLAELLDSLTHLRRENFGDVF